jgi:poly(3-hydroxybutyrate) depolymerase
VRRLWLLIPLAGLLCGCPVTQSQDTPVDPLDVRASATQEPALVYVPSYHSRDRRWPLVITLHGTHVWDGYRRQMMEWKALAERQGLIVAAPYLKSPQGILPVIRDLWMKDLAHDEKTILSLIDQLAWRYNVDTDCVMLTGFSAGGYPMYYTGLRNPGRFQVLVGRAANVDVEMLEAISPPPEAKKLPIYLFVGRDDIKALRDQAWAAYRWLRERDYDAERHRVEGGHLRRPEIAWKFWQQHLPKEYRGQ